MLQIALPLRCLVQMKSAWNKHEITISATTKFATIALLCTYVKMERLLGTA